MNILIAISGTRGDVQPGLALSIALKQAGHDVTLAGPPENETWVTSYGIPFEPLGSNFSEFVSGFPNGMDLKARFGFGSFMRREAEIQFDQLPALAENRDLLITVSLVVCGPSVAERNGIPHVFLITCPQLLASGHHPPIALKKQTLPVWLNRSLFGVADRMMDLVFNGIVNRRRVEMGLERIKRFVPYFLSGRNLVISDDVLARVPDDVIHNWRQVGHLALSQQGELGDDIEAFLAAGPPPVYIGFGSMAEHEEQMTETIYKASEISAQRVVVGSGWGHLGRLAHDDNVLVIDNVPHTKLFPRMAAVVHHGGAGTTATAARAGVPQVIVPHLLDQFYWAHRVKLLGIGPEGIPQDRLNAERLAEAMRTAAMDPTYKTKAEEVANELKGRNELAEAVSFVEEAGG